MSETAQALPKPQQLDRDEVGARLRAVRKQQKLTLKQLSDLSGVAVSTLSKMELAQVAVSYDKLAAAARALQVDIAQLFRPLPPVGGLMGLKTFVKTRVDETAGYDTGGYEYYPIAGDFPQRSMTPLYARIFAREVGEFDDYVRHPGQEFAMVVSGRVRIQFETGESVCIGLRETAYFDSSVGHLYLNDGDAGEAQVMVVMSELRPAE
ncbi:MULTISPECIES: helix-turn-helix domain-containing protein [unclassified Pseudomonas]|uniref:helix-turn-helix domain-containing protein n=1 Tax=unclassified Pseudomonas TaxID=196821 RepID=UPI001EFBD63B|nr:MULTISPECIES: XRE family transcriptional regulator [unclassified Pseudomonas]MCG8905802.1 XRE family transcriptional regulator [Pseudomonas sp. DP-17]MDU4252538.1 XRE family transcriptional regulator [Pseudomonas sp.]